MDNLAWVWVHERGLTKKISRNQVGLRAKSEQVRGTFSPEFRAYLVTLDEEWFPYITDYRDALAHRIPLYVPQRVRTEDLDQYNDLTRRMNEAIESGQWEEHGVLFYEQNSLVVYQPFNDTFDDRDERQFFLSFADVV